MKQSQLIKGFGMALCLTLTGCMTPAEERQIKDDIFSLQTRLMAMEGQVSSTSKEITAQSGRTEASMATRLDKIAIEIQRVKGDIDALRVGIQTGVLPGADGTQETAAQKNMADVLSRIDAIEENQNKIIAAIDKAIETKKPEKKRANDDADKKEGAEKIKTFKDLKTAFDGKNFKAISDSGDKVVDSFKQKKTRQEALFMLAESHYKSGKIRDAALRYNDYLESKPSDNLSFSLLRMGDCFKQLGDVDTAKIYYQELIQKYGKSEEAKQAKEKLAKL
ncbi:MAG: tetratricopeptide repeat protein [Proteobacteria bacterium]|nr:MAG: tetratricopeptide repeat protein [Pseudomonadota bacterium]